MADTRGTADVVISNEQFDELLNRWDTLHNSCQRISTSQPAQMTGAAEALEAARLGMRDTINQITLAAARRRLP